VYTAVSPGFTVCVGGFAAIVKSARFTGTVGAVDVPYGDKPVKMA
jgi:hypothetical protein